MNMHGFLLKKVIGHISIFPAFLKQLSLHMGLPAKEPKRLIFYILE
jgi:hypothetical protein